MRTLPSPKGSSLVLLLCLFVTACTLIAPYDATTDRTLNDLVVRTETFLVQAEATRASYSESARFYREAIGTTRALQVRAGLYQKNQEETELLKHLEEGYNDLAEIHREGPITASVAGGLRTTLRALLRVQLAKKRSAVFSANLEKSGNP
jgi:hypothetical protein